MSLSDRIGEHAPWEERAACRLEDPELFWPQDSDGWTTRRAKAVCRRCDVREECLDAALTEGHDEGIWGGMSPTERRKILRSRVKAVMAR